MNKLSCMPVATCFLKDRLGNNFYQAAMVIAYAKKYDMAYYMSYYHHSKKIDQKLPFGLSNTARKPRGWPTEEKLYREPINAQGLCFYHAIPRLDQPCFDGYWQSFKYIDDYRGHVLDVFALPYSKECRSFVAIHVRRGDYLTIWAHQYPVLPLDYYKKAIAYFKDKGYTDFMVFSDDIPWCKSQFNDRAFGVHFTFSENHSAEEDLYLMSSCDSQIIANSSFSFAAAWLNINPDKIVISPPQDKICAEANIDMVPSQFIQMPFIGSPDAVL